MSPISRDPHPNAEQVPESERPCPICGERMSPERQHGVKVDICEQHGIWFDSGELEAFCVMLKAKELPARRQRLKEARVKARRETGIRGYWLNFLGE